MSRNKDVFWSRQIKEAREDSDLSRPDEWFNKFRNYADADAFFTHECGDDWESQPWVKFLMYGEGSDAAEKQRNELRSIYLEVDFDRPDHQMTSGKMINVALRDAKNHEYMVRYYVRKGITDLDTIIRLETERYHNQLKFEPGYDERYGKSHRKGINRYTMRALVNKYINEENKKKGNPERWIILELIKHYTNLGLSSRKIEQRLEKDGIRVSYRHVQNLQKQIKESEQ